IKQYGWPLAALPNGWHTPWSFIENGTASIGFFVSVTFALVSCAIPSGSFSGRMKFSAYLLFAVLYVGVAYPIFACILWNGPLARLGVQDYAGSLGVHAVGGIMGLVGAKFLGKRHAPVGAHDVPMMGLGAMLLMFCWFGFNLGSVPSYGNITADLPLVAINTLAAMAGGIIGSMAITGVADRGKTDPIITPNGGLAGAIAYGLVAATVIFSVIDKVFGLRVSEAEEVSGMDIAAHGMAAYPELHTPATPLHVLSGVRISEVMVEAPAVSPEDSLDAVQEV